MTDVKKDEWADGKEVESNWFKFEKVGDRIKGTIMSREYREGDGDFSAQWVYELKKSDGEMWNVGIAATKIGTIGRLKNCKIGEIIGIIFDSEGEPPKKGFHPVKNLKVVTFGMDPNYDEMEGGDEVSPLDKAMNEM